MKELVKIQGPRDCSVKDILVRIARLNYALDRDYKIVSNASLFSYPTRSMAFARIERAEELLKTWKEVLKDVEQKSERKEVISL